MGNIVKCPEPFEGLFVDQSIDFLFGDRLDQIGLDRSRADRIDGNPIG